MYQNFLLPVEFKVTLEEEEKKLAEDFAEEVKNEDNSDNDEEDKVEIKTSVAFRNVS